MNGNNGASSIGMFEEMMTTFNSGYFKADMTKESNQLLSPHARKFRHDYTSTV